MDREQIYDAIRNADKAGDTEAVKKLTDYLNELPEFDEQADTKSKEEPFQINPALATVGGGVSGWVGHRVLPKAYEQTAEAFGLKTPNFLDAPSGVSIPDKYVSQGPNGVKNWAEATYGRPYQGGKSFAEEAKLQEKLFKPRENLKSSKRVPQVGSLSVLGQAEEASIPKIRAERLAKAKNLAQLPGKVAQAASMKGIPTGMLGGYNAAETINRLETDPVGAVIGGAGTLGSAASYSKNPIVKGVGLAVGAGAAGINTLRDRLREEEEQKKKAKGFAAGSAVKGGLNALKKSFTPKPTKVVRASEALGPHEGKYVILTQSDRMRSTGGDLGGPGFSKFQLERPEYAEAGAAWGVGNKPTASGIINVNKKFPEGKAIWTPMIGSEGQHRSNQHVYDALTEEFARQTSMGKLPPELRAAMNERLGNFNKYKQLGLTDIDVANPEKLKELGNTFDRRAAIAEVIGGEGVGGRKGQIFDYPGIMQEMTDPMTIGAPTHSMGTRLFTLNNEMEYRPDLHSAFPFILKGEDMGVAFNPVPKELAFPEWINLAKEFTGREPGYMEFTRGIKGKGKPHQFISEEYLRALEEAGHKAGGHIDGYAGGSAVKKGVQSGLGFLKPSAKSHSQDPKVARALEEYLKGNISQQERINVVNRELPLRPWTELPPAYTDEQIKMALMENKRPKALVEVPAGMRVGNRLDIPAYTQNGVYVDTTHNLAGSNSPISYNRTGHLKDVEFSSKPNQAVRVGLGTKEQALTPMGAEMGAAKSPFAMIKGTNVGTNDEEVRRMLAEYLNDPNWAQIGMDPRRHSQFYDKKTGMPVWSAEEKLQSGPLVLVPRRGLEMTTWDDPRLNLSDFPGKQYAEGGHTSPAWQRKEGKNPEGGLNAAGRASYNRETGGNLKPPVSAEQAKKSPKSAARRKSFCARMSGMEGPMKDEKGRPTRKALALRKWDC